MALSLSSLPYSVSALEPYISKMTVELHHGKHHASYIAKVNDLAASIGLSDLPLEALVRTAYKRGDFALFNNASQAWNHEFYWNSLHPEGGGPPHGQVAKLIDNGYEGPEAFVERLRAAATGHFGSGWAWIVVEDGRIKITHTDNAVSPLIYRQVPLLAIDVWEHAYYLDYQNRRDNYVRDLIAHLIDWDFANRNLALSMADNSEPIPGRENDTSAVSNIQAGQGRFDGTHGA